MSIFVNLVSYKNFDTVPTVLDCINKASDKQGLRIGLILQQDEEIPAELNLPNVFVQRFSVADSKGQGWARSVAQSMYASEDYVMQTDSGTRFAEGWDSILIDAVKATGKEKPIISNYCNKFNPDNGDMEVRDTAYRQQPHLFLNATPSCWGSPMKGVKQITPARIVSDNYMFTLGSHSRECLYDPLLYWNELDCWLSLKSFKAGYDLFNHFIPVVWRNYNKRPQHWEDHQDWWNNSQESEASFNALLLGPGIRSLDDYQRYSGLDLIGRRIHRDVLGGKNPPVEYVDENSWNSAMAKDYSITVSWDVNEIERCDDYDYWYFAIEDAAGNNIIRQDLRHERDAQTIEFKTNYRKMFFKSFEGRTPAALCIWPLSKSKGWLKKSKFPVDSAV
jgi:hypothetical protein